MLTLASPAKINLFLRILNRRPDGYHELASLFQAVDLCDLMTFTLADSDCLRCSDSSLPTGPSNLIWRAIDLFRQRTGLNKALHVILDKRIPIEAGLGGGSSNGATALWAINRLLGFPVATSDLMAWAAEIGADVAFFFSSGTAYCTGRGEMIRSLPPLPSQNLHLVKPLAGLSTPAVYRQLDLDSLSPLEPEWLLAEWLAGRHALINDLEAPAFALKPHLRALKRQLLDAGFDAQMSGSGSAFFCLGKGALPPSVATYAAAYTNRPSNGWYPLPL
jgi:4-diphosphocytidyl-2-C-methyl-D-erythritol kinase